MWSSAGSAGIVFSTRSAHAEVSWIFFFKPFLALFVMFSWFFGFLLILDVVSLVCCFVLWSSLVLGCSLLQIKDWIFSSCCFRVWLDWATNYRERKEREKEEFNLMEQRENYCGRCCFIDFISSIQPCRRKHF